MGELRGETFKKLLEMLVDSVLLYGAEVWGSCRNLAPMEKIQLRAARIFLGVGRLHPKISLQFELNTERQKERGIDAGKQMSGGTGGKGSGRQKEGEVGKQKSTGKGTKRVVK